MIALANSRSRPDEDSLDPLLAAESAGLQYVLDTEPGFRRRSFRKPRGLSEEEQQVLRLLIQLAVGAPP